MDIGSEQENPTPAREARLAAWLEQEARPTAVAVFGCSIEDLQKILETNEVPSSPITLPYQRRLIGKGGYLYYFAPIFAQIRESNPVLAQKIESKFRPSGHSAHEALSVQEAEETAVFYAQARAIQSYFLAQTGIEADDVDVLILARDLIPEDYQRFLLGVGQRSLADAVESETELAAVDNIRNQIDESRLKEILSGCLQRRGVVLYFNNGIFTPPNRAYPGHEDEHEIMVVSRRPLSANTITGIDILSDTDRREVNL